jgi:hypothetical protein
MTIHRDASKHWESVLVQAATSLIEESKENNLINRFYTACNANQGYGSNS